jgi:hypothetical protein
MWSLTLFIRNDVELRDRRTFADDSHTKRTPYFSLALDAVHPLFDALFVILMPTLTKLEWRCLM